jgi:hypothetical protein
MHYAPSERDLAMVNETFPTRATGNKTGNKPRKTVPYAQRHVADVDIFEREAFEHELLRPARRPRVGRDRPRLTQCRIDSGSRPRADVDHGLAWP